MARLTLYAFELFETEPEADREVLVARVLPLAQALRREMGGARIERA